MPARQSVKLAMEAYSKPSKENHNKHENSEFMFCSSHDKQTFPATTTQSHARLQKDLLRLRTKQNWSPKNGLHSTP